MPDFVYEKNLCGMKLNVLACPNQDACTAAIAEIIGVGKQVLRRFLIEQLDMAYLENIPARYDSWRKFYAENKTDRLPIAALFTDYLPVQTPEMAKVQGRYAALIRSGTAKEDAEKECISLIAAIVSDAGNQHHTAGKSNLTKNSAPRYTAPERTGGQE
jgi:energy-converting hydrogenase A subunit M